MRIIMLVLILCMEVQVHAASSTDDPIRYFNRGYGADRCGDFTESLKLADSSVVLDTARGRLMAKAAIYVSWVDGFLTNENIQRAIGQKKGDQIDFSYPALTAWMNNYCKKHPLSSIAEAAGALIAVSP